MNTYKLWRVTYEVSQKEQRVVYPMPYIDKYFAILGIGLGALEQYIVDLYGGQIVEITSAEYIGLIEIESPRK